MRRRILLPILALAVMLVAPTVARAADDWVVRQSAQSVAETVSRLEEAITRSGSLVLAVFDHRESAREVGLDLPASTVVVFAKPRTSSPLIAQNPRVAMDLPQKILVWEEEGVTYAGFVSPMALVTRYGFDDERPELRSLRAALDSLLLAAVGRRASER